jgi:hypothetical protein
MLAVDLNDVVPEGAVSVAEIELVEVPGSLLFLQEGKMIRKPAIEKTNKKILTFIGLNFVSLFKRPSVV